MHKTVFLALSLSSLMALSPVAVAEGKLAATEQVLTFSASARQEVSQDWLTVVARAQIEGKDPATVQTQLNAIVQAALARRHRSEAGEEEGEWQSRPHPSG